MAASTKLSAHTPAKSENTQRVNPQDPVAIEKLRIQRDAIRERSIRMFRRVAGGRF
jgi:hypothetical protein